MGVKPEYRAFKQLVNEFRLLNVDNNEEIEKSINLHTIKLEPKVIYNTFNKTIKMELRIGTKNMYVIKNLIEFYDNMINNNYYKYGSKLAFKHNKEVFEEESISILNYVLKYAEILKYANETAKEYAVWNNKINDRYIIISNSGIDELFELLRGKSVPFQINGKERTLYFDEKKPDIKFYVEENKIDEYKIYPNIDVYGYEILKGKEYTYILINDVLYRCTKEYKENELKLLETFKNTFETEIIFPREELPKLFSFIYTKVKSSIDLSKIEKEKIEKYIPDDLYVKVYLDYDKANHITCDIKFIYGDIEFNPLDEQQIDIARDISKEDETLELFRKAGFMFDIKNKRLILVNNDTIYNFLSYTVEEFMQKFEVLATESFKQKEIRTPQIGGLGVRIENNLL